MISCPVPFFCSLGDTPPAELESVEWASFPDATSVPCPAPLHDADTGVMRVLIDLPAGAHLRFDLSATMQGAPAAQAANTATLAAPAGLTDHDLQNNSSAATVPVLSEGILRHGFEAGCGRREAGGARSRA
jgi:hypothetical protein